MSTVNVINIIIQHNNSCSKGFVPLQLNEKPK